MSTSVHKVEVDVSSPKALEPAALKAAVEAYDDVSAVSVSPSGSVWTVELTVFAPATGHGSAGGLAFGRACSALYDLEFLATDFPVRLV